MLVFRAPGRVAEPDLPEGEMPENWDARLEKLPRQTLVLALAALRPRLRREGLVLALAIWA